MDSTSSTTARARLGRRVAIVAAILAAALMPVSVDWGTGQVRVTEGICQGTECKAMYQWSCGDVDDKCDTKYSMCRQLLPEYPPSDEGYDDDAAD